MFFRDLRVVLREPHFGELYATRVSSQLSDGVFQVALAGYVLFAPERATTAARTAGVIATVLLPYSIVGPFAGVFIDRWRRQRILVVSNVVRAVMVAGVALLAVAGVDDWRLFAAALAVLSVNRFFLASLSAALPHVAQPHWLVMANSVSTTSGTNAAALGGGIGLGVQKLAGDDDTGTALVMLVAALGYLLSATLAARMGATLLGPDYDPAMPETVEALRRVVRGMAEGARHVWERRHAAESLAAITAHRFFYGLSTVATLLLYRNYFDNHGVFRGGLAGLTQVLLASATGVLVAAVVTPAATERFGKDAWIAGCFGVAAITEVALGVPYTQPALLAAAFVLGVVAQGSKICVDTIVQETVEDAYRGRVFSFYDILFNVSFVSAAAVAALLLPETGKSYAVLAVIATGYAVTALGYATARQSATIYRRLGDSRSGPEVTVHDVE